MPPNPKRGAVRLLKRRQEVADLYLTGKSQNYIAQQLGVHRSLITRDLQTIHEYWLDSFRKAHDMHQAEELARVLRVENEAWTAWEASKQPREVTVTEQIEGGDIIDITPDAHGNRRRVKTKEPLRKASVQRFGQTGNPLYLQIIQKCIDQRIGILGLNAPTRFSIDWDNLSDEQVARLAAGADPAQVVMAEA